MSGNPGESWEVDQDLEKHPIHLAAELLDLPKLRQLLQADSCLVNQKYYDLTPFHIVVEMLNTENFSNVFEAIKILLKFNADINCPAINTTFHTPFSLLLKKLPKVKVDRKQELVEYIVENCAFIDVDTYRNGEARILLEKHFPDLLHLFKHSSVSEGLVVNNKEQVLAKLMQHLEVNEKKFLQSLTTLKKDDRFANIIQEILHEGILLEETVKRGLEVSVEELLQMGANPNGSSHGNTYTPIGIACQRGFWKILKLLSAEQDNLFKKDPLLHIVVKNLEGKLCSQACDYYKCFDFLINNVNLNVNDQDEWGNTALHYAVRYKNKYAIKKLLEKKACIATANIFKALPIRDIAPEVLESFFDSCITTNGERPGDDEFEIRIDYSCLVPPELLDNRVNTPSFSKELLPIQYMAATNELKHLLQHPLIASFLFLKWFRLSPIFYANLFFYSIYCVSLVSYIVFCFDADSTIAKLLRALSVLGAVYVLIRELAQFIVAPINYLKSPENYLEIGLICLTWIVLCPTMSASFDKDEINTIHHVFGATTIMFVAAELSMLVGSLPFFTISTHMVMLKTVSMSFLRGLGLYSIILVAFAFSFYTLFSTETQEHTDKDIATNEDELNKFVDPGRAIIKTIVMLTGEFEASSIDFHQNALSYLIFVLFLFFMSIVVLNLLNGLAVSDTQMIKSQAELNNWLERTRLLSNYENIMLGANNQYQNFFMKLFCMQQGSSSIISLFPDYLPMHAVHIKINKIPANQMMVPFKPATEWNTESGEMYPLVGGKSGDAVKKLESPVKALSCCFSWTKCAVMDKKIMNDAIKVLDKKERRLVEASEKDEVKGRIEEIEKKLDEILKILIRD